MKNNFHTLKCMIAIIVFSLPLFMSANAESMAVGTDSIIVQGTIVDAHTKMPVNAARISSLDEKISTVSNEQGKFKLILRAKDETLTVEAYDYVKVEIGVRGNTELNINLYPDNFSSYFKNISTPTGVQNNALLSISALSTENIDDIVELSADGIIQNKLGGAVRAVSQSGALGAGNALFIRGINSLNAYAQPLFVVDGVIWSNYGKTESVHSGYAYNPLEVIDVNDIEDITVLKDGTSLYGSKGANGVILINTKRAKSMVTKIGLNIFYGMSEAPKSVPMMNGDEFRLYASDMLKTATGDVSSAFLGNSSDVRNSKYYNNTDWYDEVYQTGNTSNYLINVDGGDERALYYFSLGYTQGKGVVQTTDLQRLNARFNVDARLARTLTMGLNMAYSRSERNLQDDGINDYYSPAWQAQIKSPFLSPYNYTSSGEITTRYAFVDDFGIANPSGVIDLAQNKLKKYKFNIGVFPEWTIIPELTLKTQFDYSLDNSSEAYFVPESYIPTRYIYNYGTSKNKLRSQTFKTSVVYSDTKLTYKKVFGENSLKAMLGFRYDQRAYVMNYVEEHNSGANTNTQITGDYDFQIVDGVNNVTKSISNYAHIDYDYRKKYFLSATMSLDASSRFGKQTEGGISMLGVSWGVFPSVNGAWLFSSETFMQPLKFISFGKLRAGYGITGNDDIPDYESMAYLTSVRFTNIANGLVLSHLENDKIQWEQTARANAGIDLGLFDNRLSLSFDVFKSNTSNLLTQMQLPEVVGKGLYWINGGGLENKGYEFSVNLRALNLKDFQWEVGFNVGHYKNTITSLVNTDGYYITSVYGGEVISQVGQAAALFYGYKTNGVFSTQADADAAGLKRELTTGDYEYFAAGDIHFVDNGDGIINEQDKQVIGDPNPDLYGNFSSAWTYKRFKLNAFFTYSYGNDVYNYYRQMLESGSGFNNQTKAMLNRWVADGQQTSQPKATYGDPMGNARFSDRWIEDGSYIKLKKLTLSYDFPMKNDYIRGINLWLSATNLFTLTNYLGRDPEFYSGHSVYSQGIDAGLLPSTRGYYVGVRVDL